MNDMVSRQQLFDQARGAPASQATTIEQSRAVAEVQGALVVAQQRPRDKAAALAEAIESCSQMGVAEAAFFKFPRGGSTVSGETIHLAVELARCWGNIAYGIMELARDDVKAESEMLAYAWDLQTNAQSRMGFIVPHKRDKKGGAEILTDLRDIYENNANMGSRRLRECIFRVMPRYLIDAAVEQCHATLRSQGGEKPLPVRLAEAIKAFSEIGIAAERIEARYGKIGALTDVDLANLKISYRSIKRGEIDAEIEFPRVAAAQTTAALKAGKQKDKDQPSEASAASSPSEADAGTAESPQPDAGTEAASQQDDAPLARADGREGYQLDREDDWGEWLRDFAADTERAENVIAAKNLFDKAAKGDLADAPEEVRAEVQRLRDARVEELKAGARR